MRIPLPCETSGKTSETLNQLALALVLEQFNQEAEWGECDTGRYRCRYFAWGEGPPLVFIHGLADDATSFILPMLRLSRDFRCIAYHLPAGNGDGANVLRYRHDDLIDDLYNLLDHLQMERTYLFGSSFGSTIALRAMHQSPARFPRAVLQGGFAHRSLAQAERWLAWLGRYLPLSMHWFPFRKATLHHEFYEAFQHCESAVWEYFLERSSNQPMQALAYRGWMLTELDLRPLLPEIHQPILMVCGNHDPLVSRGCEKELLHGLPHVMRAEIENGGHYPYFTHPEVTAELVLRFLTPLPCR